MAGEVAQSRLLDFMAATLDKVPANEYANLMINQAYGAEDFIKSLKPREMTGRKLLFNAMLKGATTTDSDAATAGIGRYGPYEVVPLEAKEYMEQGEIPWATYITHWIVSSHELRWNRGKEGYIDIATEKKEGCMTEFANILEADFWSAGSYAYESGSKPAILGPNYWITDDGYHVNDSGGTNGTEVGGLNPANSAFNDANSRNRWRNQFQSIGTANELLDAMDAIFIDSKFMAPPSVKMNTKAKYKKFKIRMTKTSYKLYKQLLRRLEETVDTVNPTFNNLSVDFCDQIPTRSDSTEETFFFNMDTWRAYADSGNYFRKEKPFKPQNQDARAQYIYLWWALVCQDRRSNGKIFGYSDFIEA